MTRHTVRLGDCRFEILTSGDLFLGLGTVWIANTPRPLGSPSAPPRNDKLRGPRTRLAPTARRRHRRRGSRARPPARIVPPLPGEADARPQLRPDPRHRRLGNRRGGAGCRRRRPSRPRPPTGDGRFRRRPVRGVLLSLRVRVGPRAAVLPAGPRAGSSTATSPARPSSRSPRAPRRSSPSSRTPPGRPRAALTGPTVRPRRIR